MRNNDEDGKEPHCHPSIHASMEIGWAGLMEDCQIKSVDWYAAKETLITISSYQPLPDLLLSARTQRVILHNGKKDLNCGGFNIKRELLLSYNRECSSNDNFEIPVPVSLLSNHFDLLMKE